MVEHTALAARVLASRASSRARSPAFAMSSNRLRRQTNRTHTTHWHIVSPPQRRTGVAGAVLDQCYYEPVQGAVSSATLDC